MRSWECRAAAQERVADIYLALAMRADISVRDEVQSIGRAAQHYGNASMIRRARLGGKR